MLYSKLSVSLSLGLLGLGMGLNPDRFTSWMVRTTRVSCFIFSGVVFQPSGLVWIWSSVTISRM